MGNLLVHFSNMFPNRRRPRHNRVISGEVIAQNARPADESVELGTDPSAKKSCVKVKSNIDMAEKGANPCSGSMNRVRFEDQPSSSQSALVNHGNLVETVMVNESDGKSKNSPDAKDEERIKLLKRAFVPTDSSGGDINVSKAKKFKPSDPAVVTQQALVSDQLISIEAIETMENGLLKSNNHGLSSLVSNDDDAKKDSMQSCTNKITSIFSENPKGNNANINVGVETVTRTEDVINSQERNLEIPFSLGNECPFDSSKTDGAFKMEIDSNGIETQPRGSISFPSSLSMPNGNYVDFQNSDDSGPLNPMDVDDDSGIPTLTSSQDFIISSNEIKIPNPVSSSSMLSSNSVTGSVNVSEQRTEGEFQCSRSLSFPSLPSSFESEGYPDSILTSIRSVPYQMEIDTSSDTDTPSPSSFQGLDTSTCESEIPGRVFNFTPGLQSPILTSDSDSVAELEIAYEEQNIFPKDGASQNTSDDNPAVENNGYGFGSPENSDNPSSSNSNQNQQDADGERPSTSNSMGLNFDANVNVDDEDADFPHEQIIAQTHFHQATHFANRSDLSLEGRIFETLSENYSKNGDEGANESGQAQTIGYINSWFQFSDASIHISNSRLTNHSDLNNEMPGAQIMKSSDEAFSFHTAIGSVPQDSRASIAANDGLQSAKSNFSTEAMNGIFKSSNGSSANFQGTTDEGIKHQTSEKSSASYKNTPQVAYEDDSDSDDYVTLEDKAVEAKLCFYEYSTNPNPENDHQDDSD